MGDAVILTKKRERTAPRAWSVLRAVAAATLLLSAAAEAADGPTPATAAKPVSVTPASAPAAHDSMHSTGSGPSRVAATSPDEPPAPAQAPLVRAVAKPVSRPAAAAPAKAPVATATKTPGPAPI